MIRALTSLTVVAISESRVSNAAQECCCFADVCNACCVPFLALCSRAQLCRAQVDPVFEGLHGGEGSLIKYNPLSNLSSAETWNFLRVMVRISPRHRSFQQQSPRVLDRR